MKHQFIVTIEGKWRHGDRPATKADARKMLREAVKTEFEFLAKATVSEHSSPTQSKEAP